jgi:hypothetical protein
MYLIGISNEIPHIPETKTPAFVAGGRTPEGHHDIQEFVFD